jgi:hypothetical protein
MTRAVRGPHSSHSTTSTLMPIRLLTFPPSLLLGYASTAGTEVVAVVEVDADADTARRLRRLKARRPRAHAEGPLERVLRPGDLFRPNPGRSASCAAPACAIALSSTCLVRRKGRDKLGR